MFDSFYDSPPSGPSTSLSTKRHLKLCDEYENLNALEASAVEPPKLIVMTSSEEEDNFSNGDNSDIYEPTVGELIFLPEPKSEGEGDDDIGEDVPHGESEDDTQRRGRKRERSGPRGSPPQGISCIMDTMVWTECDIFQPKVPVCDRNSGGITHDFPCSDKSREVDYFCAFFDEEMCQFICDETNKYHALCEKTGKITSSAKMQKWVTLRVPEFYVFMALLLLMTHVRKHVMNEYWLVNDITATPTFGKYMSRNRFCAILRFLHFADNQNALEDPEENRLWKIRSILEKMREKFAKFFCPFQNVIDDSLSLFKGRIIFHEYIPSKRTFGMKFFIICDYETGYCLDLVIYSGTDVDINTEDKLGFSAALVKKLMDRYFGGDHTLYTDSYYTAPAVSKFLLERDSGSCGTVRANKKHWPKLRDPLGKELSKLKRADKMLAIQWLDNKPGNVLSAIHTSALKEAEEKECGTEEKVKIPEAILDYNVHMRLFDKADMHIGEVECVSKTVKWYKKIFLHFTDILMLNAYNLYLFKTRKHLSLRHFSKLVIEQLLNKFFVRVALPHPSFPSRKFDRLVYQEAFSKHQLTKIPNKLRRRCQVCKQTRPKGKGEKRSFYQCSECDIGLCPSPCFAQYHSHKIF